MNALQLEPEARRLLRQIAERHAFRHHVAINLRGYGLQFIDEVAELRTYADEIGFQVSLLESIERTYHELGGENLDDAVQPRMERVPSPESRLEVACCLTLLQRGQRVAARAYVESVHPGLALVSRQILEHERAPLEEDCLAAFCRRDDHRRAAQTHWTRWLQLCLGSVGRLETQDDQRVVELGLRAESAVDLVRAFLDDLEPVRAACGLKQPTLDDLSIELPEDLRGRFPSA